MFSTDKNIESIASLVESLKRYAGLKSEYVKLSIVDKLVRIITALALGAVIMLIAILLVIFLSFAAAYTIGAALDSMVMGFLIVAAVHFLLLLLFVAKRKVWIEQPLVKFLAEILLG